MANPERSALANLTLARLDAVLDRLPSEARWLFWLREVEGLSYGELAEVFSVELGTIRSRLARLRARLVTGLGEQAGRRRVRAGGGGDE